MNIIYLKIYKSILEGSDLKLNFINKTAELYTKNNIINIDYVISTEIIKAYYIELDCCDLDNTEAIYKRNLIWKEGLNKLKKEYPILFRKEKINNLLNF